MATKLSVIDILEAKYIESIETTGKDPGNFYMNEDMLHILYKEIKSWWNLSWEDAKEHGLQYRGIIIKITESTFLGEIIAV